jgi:hypothetical protein
MHNELRYQAKTNTISEELSKEKKKKFRIFSPIYLFIYFLLKTIKQKKKQGHAYGKGNNI